MQDARKYISDFCNISTATSNISAIFIIYRLTDNFRQSHHKKKLPELIRQSFITYVTPHQISLLPLLIHGYVLLLLLRLLMYVLHRSSS
ncbi:hypothetical protein EXW56_22170 [Bacillus mycoides]|nr:hypothetical protein EXW56_22170 [Bacillus mycoides]